MKAIPLLLVLITEVEEAWSVEQELHQVVRDQQHQAQSVEAKQTGCRERDSNIELTEDNSAYEEREETTLNTISYSSYS